MVKPISNDANHPQVRRYNFLEQKTRHKGAFSDSVQTFRKLEIDRSARQPVKMLLSKYETYRFISDSG